MRHLLAVCLLVSGSVALQASEYTVLQTPTTVEWGHSAANAKPAVTIQSRVTVTLQTLSTCGPRERLAARGVRPEDIPANNDAV